MTSKKLHAPENWTFHTFTSKDGLPVRYGFATPPGPSRGTVVLTGGYGRHIEYYFEKINNWRDRGYTVYAMDWYGQGGSGRENPDRRRRPSNRAFDDHVEMFHEFVSEIVKPARNRPAFLSSHSKGGNIMLRYLHKYEKDADFPFCGAILGAPMLHINTYILPRGAFRRAVNALHAAGLSRTPLPSCSQLFWDFREAVLGHGKKGADKVRKDVHDAYKKETSALEVGFPTIGWLRQAVKSNDIVMDEKFLKSIHTPVLILTTEADSLVCVDAQRRAAALLPNARQHLFSGAKHGIWYDTDAVQHKLWVAIDNFTAPLEERFYAYRHNLLQLRLLIFAAPQNKI